MATATDVVAPYWQMFEPPMIDKSTIEFEYVEYQQRDANQVDKADGGQYTIETRDMDAYLLPYKEVLEVRGRLTKADGSGDHTDEEIMLTNGGWSLFRSGKYEMNNNTAEDMNEFLLQASTTINLLSYSDDYGRSRATNMLWYKDTGTAGASSRKYTDVSVAAVIPDNTWTSDAHTTRTEFRKGEFLKQWL